MPKDSYACAKETNELLFDQGAYEVKVLSLRGTSIKYRAYEGIDYCLKPADPIQKLNIFVPEDYYQGACRSGYSLHTAPIFMPNTVGGYMPGPADTPGYDHKGRINSIFRALEHGYIVASAGVRGRTSGRNSNEFFEGSVLSGVNGESGMKTGKAPAFIVDMKAAIRYLRYNRELIPGDTDHIITSGTSAGGALSALAGASGDCAEYEPYLSEIGAADAKDHIFAASCYCPIHNLENADSAYEWQFYGCNDYHRTKHVRTADGIGRVPDDGVMDECQIRVSGLLKALFPDYLNSLGLRDKDGESLFLDKDGKGSFLEYVRGFVEKSAEKELEQGLSAGRLKAMGEKERPVLEQPFISMDAAGSVRVDWDSYIKTITRMKPAPAFDSLDLKSPENDEFGDPGAVGQGADAKHFTEFSHAHSLAGGLLADPAIVRLMNPASFIGCGGTAKYWRIRHGAFDRDTSLAIPVILATLLMDKGYSVDFALPWGLPHSGDYDLDELFGWIDSCVADACCRNSGSA